MSFFDFDEHLKNTRTNPETFDPYATNGGGVIAIAGDNYALIGADTRLSARFSIYSRNQSKLFKLTDKAVVGITGCWADANAFSSFLKTRGRMYLHEHQKPIPTIALAQMAATALYYKRFFPYYVLTIIAGLDNYGEGCVFSYDPIGHFERTKHYASGTASTLLQPLLDNQIDHKNKQGAVGAVLTMEKNVSLMKDLFTGAAERDIYTGDSIQIMTITSDRIDEEIFPLRKD